MMSSALGVMPTTTSKLSFPAAKWVMLKAERSVKNFGEAQAEIEKSSGAPLADSMSEVVPCAMVTSAEL